MNCIIIGDKPVAGMKSKGWVGTIAVNKRDNLVQNQIRVISKIFPNAKIVYIYGFDEKKAFTYFEEMTHRNLIPIYNNKYDTHGQMYSLGLAHEYLNQNTLIFPGDILLKPSIFDKFNNKESQIYIKKSYDDLGCTINKRGKIEHISYYLKNYLANVYYFNKKNTEILRPITRETSMRNYFLFEAINKMIDSGVRFSPTLISNNKFLNNIYNYQKLKEFTT